MLQKSAIGGLTGWLLSMLHKQGRARPQLAILERITLAPRQSLALIQAAGNKVLVATSADGTPVFYPMGNLGRRTRGWEKEADGIPLLKVSWLPE